VAPALYVDLPAFFAIAEMGAADNLPSEESLDYDSLRPYVDELGSLIAGSRHSDGLVVTRVTLTLSQ
jgi:hypothetical protein